MSDHDQGDREKKIPYEGEAILLNSRIEDLEREQKDEKRRDEGYKNLQLQTNKRLAWFTGGLLVTSFIANLIYLDLAIISRRNSEAAQESAAAAKLAAETTYAQLFLNKAGTEETLTQMKKQTKAQQDAAKAASDSIKATQAAMRLDQRAWVGIGQLSAVPESFHVNDKASVSVGFNNTGKTPAKNLMLTIVLVPVNRGERPKFSYTSVNPVPYGLLPPNGENHVSLSISKNKFTGEAWIITPELFKPLVSGDIRPCFHGYMIYEDIFGNPHWMTFCYFLDELPGPVKFGACHEHNSTGDGKTPEQ